MCPVYWILGLLVYLNQRYSYENSLNNMDCVRFIGLFGLLVYFTMHTFTGEWDCVRFIRREVRHHKKHMLDDPPNMIDPINYVLLFCSIPLFKSFHVACMDNYVLKVTVIYLHLWWSCLVYWENAWKNKGPTQKKITGLFGNFSQHGGGGSSQFPKLL